MYITYISSEFPSQIALKYPFYPQPLMRRALLQRQRRPFRANDPGLLLRSGVITLLPRLSGFLHWRTPIPDSVQRDRHLDGHLHRPQQRGQVVWEGGLCLHSPARHWVSGLLHQGLGDDAGGGFSRLVL